MVRELATSARPFLAPLLRDCIWLKLFKAKDNTGLRILLGPDSSPLYGSSDRRSLHRKTNDKISRENCGTQRFFAVFLTAQCSHDKGYWKLRSPKIRQLVEPKLFAMVAALKMSVSVLCGLSMCSACKETVDIFGLYALNCSKSLRRPSRIAQLSKKR